MSVGSRRGGATAVICFTGGGLLTAKRIGAFYGCPVWCKKKDLGETCGVRPVACSLAEWTKERFADSVRLVFVGAAGIAVRSIAPFLKSKREDPAVLCVDERAKFVISLLSGHIGGANEDAAALASYLGAAPVITTATDLNGLFAVDVFARQNGLYISSMRLAKEISAALLDGEKVYFSSEFPAEGNLPPELLRLKSPARCSRDIRYQIHVGVRSLGQFNDRGRTGKSGDKEGSREEPKRREDAAFFPGEALPGVQVLYLVPRIVALGVGCRKGKAPEQMKEFIARVLEEEGVFAQALSSLCSIDLKKEEEALLREAERRGLPLRTFSARELAACPGSFTSSAFVTGVTGVDNVCERSAVLGSGMGGLLFGKRSENGMTAAAAVRNWRCRFE